MRFIMYYSSFETLLTCKFEFFSDTGWANKNYHFSNPFRPFSEVKKNISNFIKKNFFHYNVSNSGNIRSYCTDWFSVNFFASFFSLFIDLTSPNDDYKFIFRSFKIITRYCSVQLTRRKRPSNPFQLNAKWTKPFKRRTLRLNRIKRERFVFVTKILVSRSVPAIVAAMHLPNVSPYKDWPLASKYLAFGRKISPWTCTINGPRSPILFNQWFRGFLLSCRKEGESASSLLEVFSHEPVKLCGNGSWGWGMDKCKTRCRKETSRPTEMPRERFRRFSQLAEKERERATCWERILYYDYHYHSPWLNGQIWDIEIFLFDSVFRNWRNWRLKK